MYETFVYIQEVKLVTLVEGNPKASFSIATTPNCWEGRYSFSCYIQEIEKNYKWITNEYT